MGSIDGRARFSAVEYVKSTTDRHGILLISFTDAVCQVQS